MNLKGTQTEKNLLEAIAGESVRAISMIGMPAPPRRKVTNK